MDKYAKIFPSKLLLFGEYTVIQGGKALAIPYSSYYGQWKKSDSRDNLIFADGLKKIHSHIEKNAHLSSFIDNDDLNQLIDDKFIFESNIPVGYGLGSSGALVAAVYHYFLKDEFMSNDISEIRKRLSGLEGAFHGNSSGIDPLVSYIQKPLLLNNDGEIITINRFDIEEKWSLFDTGTPRQTEPLVKLYKSKLSDPNFAEAMRLLTLRNNEAIESFVNNDEKSIVASLKSISDIQFNHLKDMIPPHVQTVWYSDEYIMKLCGAGGGGMMLKYKLNTNLIN